MISREEISELKKKHHSLEKRVEKIGKRQCSGIVRLSEPLKELMDDIEATLEREKSLWNPDIVTKIKLAKKGARLTKKLKYFEEDVVREFENGNITEDIGRRFLVVTNHLRDTKLALAKKEFDYFQKILELSKEHEQSREEMEKKDRMLRKEQHRIESLLAEMSGLEKETVDPEKVRRHEELLENLEKLEGIREAYLSSLTSGPITHLLEIADSMRGVFPDLPAKEEVEGMKVFFSEYPALGSYKADQICELFDFSEKKLSHVCQETSRFKRMIMSNRKWFETARDLKRTDFLRADDEDEKAMEFYAEKSEDARKITERIKLLAKEKLSCKEEYEKKKRTEEKKKELSGCSKDSLEKELEEIEALLEFLHSDVEEKEARDGLLSKFSSFFKIGMDRS